VEGGFDGENPLAKAGKNWDFTVLIAALNGSSGNFAGFVPRFFQAAQ